MQTVLCEISTVSAGSHCIFRGSNGVCSKGCTYSINCVMEGRRERRKKGRKDDREAVALFFIIQGNSEFGAFR
jgi:hypothetical protein